MPKVARGRRKRAYRPKTRSGCPTCKIRRVKCDETRPACLRCTSTSRVCDGYNATQPPDSLQSSTVSAAAIAGPSFDTHPSLQSKRSFAFFLQRTCPQLAGFFASDFWERLVLQAAYHESAIRHAVVAIGSAHELFEDQTVKPTEAARTFALEQYSFAIRDLLAPLSQTGERSVDICLISCILFACFENMQGHHTSAISHIQSGAKLLRETVYDQESGKIQHRVLGSRADIDSFAPFEVLARMFAGLEPQIALMIGDYRFGVYEVYFSGTTYDGGPFSFSSIKEAKVIFEYGRGLFANIHVAQPFNDSMHSRAAIDDQIRHFTILISNFSIGLQAFVDSKSPFSTQRQDIAVAVLRLHVLNAHVSFHVKHLPEGYRSGWEEHMPQIMEILFLAEKIVHYVSSRNGYSGRTTSFCSDMGYIIPLYTVASRCGDPAIRRKAISLLRSASRQEGLWNSLVAAKASERIMEIEEGLVETSSGTDQARSSGIRPVLLLDGRGARLQYNSGPRSVVEEVFSWQGA